MTQTLTKAVTHLLSDAAGAGTAKSVKAAATGVHVVSEDFLNDALEDGEVPADLTPYVLQ